MEGLAFRKPSEKGQMKHRQATTELWEILLKMHILANGNYYHKKNTTIQ